MTSRKITVRGIFNESGELVRFLYQNGGGKSYFMDCEPSKDASIDEFFMEMMPPQDSKPTAPSEYHTVSITTNNTTAPHIDLPPVNQTEV